MKILVYGAGAIGSAIGGLLCQGGHEVTLLGRSEHLRAIAAAGLRLSGHWGEHRVHGLELATDAGAFAERAFDLILVTVKTYDLADAIEGCSPLVGPQTCLLGLQNGHGSVEALAAAFGRQRVLGGRVMTGAELSPGEVQITAHADAVRIGPPGGEAALVRRAEELAARFRDAGVPVDATSRFRTYRWSKILYNCGLNAMGALRGATYGEVARDPFCRRVMSLVFAEVFALCEAMSVPLPWSGRQEYEEVFDEELIPVTGNHYPSMLRDLTRRGRTEIDSLNGAVVRLGREHRVPTPANQLLTSLIEAAEAQRRADLAVHPQLPW